MSMDASRLQVSVQEQERWRRKMSVTVPAAVVREEEQRTARRFASQARLKGFRKGRVPTRVIEKQFGGALRKEALDKLIQEAYRQALESEKLQPISEGHIEDVQYEPEQDLKFEVAFDVQPVFELARLGGFAVKRPVHEVKDQHVDEVLARIREQNGAWRSVDEGSPAEGDLVSVKILRLDGSDAEARDYELVLGRGDAIPDIEASIKTLTLGGAEAASQGDFDIRFPDDLQDESRRGVQERVRITLVGRKTLELPPLDDSLAKSVGDFETLAELTAKVREDMEKENAQRADSAVRAQLLDLVLEANPFDVPASMVDRYLDSILGNPKDVPADKLAEARAQLRPEAERAVKRILAIDRLADERGLAATEDEIDARVEEIAAANQTTPAKVYASLQKAGRLESIERELTERKVFEFLTSQSEIT
ncbi:MAG: trigger factor [Gemmatimonadales bacterium]